MPTNREFLPLKGDYRSLIAFQKAECIYDVTYHFVHNYVTKGDRTADQMIQAARSGKQNIAEGGAASTTSVETEIKLINVAKASFKELLLDYEDYLRVRSLTQWGPGDERYTQARHACANHNDSAYYRDAVKLRSDETIANIAITLIHQEDALLCGVLERLKAEFLQNGGIRDQMYHGRKNSRDNDNVSGVKK